MTTYKKPFKPSFRPSFIENAVEAELQQNEDLIQQFFLVVSDGNISEIEKFINNHQDITYNATNSIGESVFHIILNNTNLDKEQKYKLCMDMINRGATVGAINSQNISVMHLACKNQMPELVQELVKRGVNINLKTSQGQTPVHFAVSPEESAVCSRIENPKEDLIPDDNIVLPDSKILQNLTTKVKALLDDKDIKKYLDHIVKLMVDPSVHYTVEFDNKIKQFKKDMVESKNKKVKDGTWTEDVIPKELQKLREEETGRLINKVDVKNELLTNDKFNEYYTVNINSKKNEIDKKQKEINDLSDKVDQELEGIFVHYDNVHDEYGKMIVVFNTLGVHMPGMPGGFIKNEYYQSGGVPIKTIIYIPEDREIINKNVHKKKEIEGIRDLFKKQMFDKSYVPDLIINKSLAWGDINKIIEMIKNFNSFACPVNDKNPPGSMFSLSNVIMIDSIGNRKLYKYEILGLQEPNELKEICEDFKKLVKLGKLPLNNEDPRNFFSNNYELIEIIFNKIKLIYTKINDILNGEIQYVVQTPAPAPAPAPFQQFYARAEFNLFQKSR